MSINSIIKYISVIIILLFFYSLYHRAPHVDDAWLGEHAYWQSKIGFVKSELMHGLTQQEDKLLCHHKLLTLQGALFINAFGFSPITLKSVSFIYYLVFLFVFYFYTSKKIFSKSEVYVALLLLISNSIVFEYSFVFRPEIPLMTLGFISYIFLDKSLKNKQHRYSFVILSGVLSGLCVSTHLNGIIFPAAGFLLFIWNKKYLQSLIFGLSSIQVILIYFYDFTSNYNIDYWLFQINKSPMLSGSSGLPSGISYLMNLLTEHMRFFHSPKEISLSVLFIISFIISFKYIKIHKNLLRFTLLLVVLLAVISVHKTSKYIILYLPYLIILLTGSLKNIYVKSNSDILFKNISYYAIKSFVFSLVVIYMALHTFFNFRIATNKWTEDINRNIVSTYITGNTYECRIVAPMTFIFNEITRFRSIQSELCYSEMQKSDNTIYKQGFLELAKFYNIDYIILSEFFITKLGMDCISEPEIKNCNFQVLLNKKEVMILKNINSRN